MDLASVSYKPEVKRPPCENCGLQASRLDGRVVLTSGVIVYVCSKDCFDSVTEHGRLAA